MPPNSSIQVTSWSLAEIFRARDAQLQGNFWLPARMAATMRTDDALFVALGNRLAPQRCVQVQIIPAADTGKARSIAREANALYGPSGVGIAAGAISDINGCLVNHGVAFGVNRMIARDDGSRIDVIHHYWPIEFVRWDVTIQQFVTRVDPASVSPGDLLAQDGTRTSLGSYEVPITHGDGRWTIYANHEHEPFKQDAAILAAGTVWARHAFALKDWAKGSVAHGNAKIIGELPEGVALQNESGLTPEAAAMIELLQELMNGDALAGLRPSGSKTDFLTNSSSAWQVWSELVGNGEKAAARVYLGTDGTLGTTGGAPGVDISELFGVAVTKVKGDLECIERGLRTGVIEPWAAMNFGDSTLAPTRRYMLPDADEEAWREAVATRYDAFFRAIESMKKNGFEVTQDVIDRLSSEYDVTPFQLIEPPEVAARRIEQANAQRVYEAIHGGKRIVTW